MEEIGKIWHWWSLFHSSESWIRPSVLLQKFLPEYFSLKAILQTQIKVLTCMFYFIYTSYLIRYVYSSKSLSPVLVFIFTFHISKIQKIIIYICQLALSWKTRLPPEKERIQESSLDGNIYTIFPNLSKKWMMISRKFWSVGTFLPNALLGLIFLHFQEVFGQKIEKMWGCRSHAGNPGTIFGGSAPCRSTNAERRTRVTTISLISLLKFIANRE